MQAIPVNLSYGKTISQRRSSEPYPYNHNTSRSLYPPRQSQRPSITSNSQHSLSIDVASKSHAHLVPSSTMIPVSVHNMIRLYSRISPSTPSIQCEHEATKLHKQRVLTRLRIASTARSSPKQHPQKQHPPLSASAQITPIKYKRKPPPKPNRNFYRRRTPKTPSFNLIHHSIAQQLDYSMTPETTKSYHTKHCKKSPRISSITSFESKSKRNRHRSHSFSASHTFSHNRSKAHSKCLPPTHYSPSITHYSSHTFCSKSPEITPPPPQIPLPPSILTHSISQHLSPNRRIRSRSLSHSKSCRNCSINSKNEKDINHHLDIDALNETETMEINNGKSLLFSSWFSDNAKKEKEDNIKLVHKSDAEDDELIHLNESDIESAIRCMDDVHSSLSSTASNSNHEDHKSSDIGVIEESKSNATFTLGLKPPRKYAEEEAEEEAKEELISFRDFLAQENRAALQREDVNVENKHKETEDEEKPNGFGRVNNNVNRFYVLKGNTRKIDYGTADGPYTLYKFVITFNHPYNRSLKLQKSHGDIYDETPRKKTSHWSIRKRYSDFVTFNHNLIAELKKMHIKSGTIKLPKLPPKTFKKNFAAAFVSQRHDSLLEYLNRVINIAHLAGSVTLLTFLGAVNNHTLPYNDKFLESRMTLSLYISNYADTGDVLLFETKSYIAASLRSVTASDYDHVGLVYRDINGTHECEEGRDRMYGLYLVESTVDGVRTYPLKTRLKQWSILCPQIVVRRLKLLKEGVQQRKAELSSSSLGSLLKQTKYTKYDYADKKNEFYSRATDFVAKVNGCDYAIWSNVLRLSDVPFEKQTSFFCSQLVTAFFKFMNLLPENVKTNRILPGHYADDMANNVKLPLINALLTNENLLLFKLPAVVSAKHRIY